MKFLAQSRYMAFFVITLSLLNISLVHAKGVGAGGGGGGIRIDKDDLVMTFGSARIPIKREKPTSDIPGLKIALDGLSSLAAPDDFKSRFREALLPTMSRSYYVVDPKNMDPTLMKNLMKEYKQIRDSLPVTKQGVATIFAYTDGRNTALLPDFFNLPDDESRAAILFHEATRVVIPQLSTSKVIEGEMAFEDYVRNKNDLDIYYAVAKLIHEEGQPAGGLVESDRDRALDDYNYKLNTAAIVIPAYLKHDIKMGAFGSAFAVDKMPFNWLAGNPGENLRTHFTDLAQQYPKSILVQYLLLNADTLHIAFKSSKYSYWFFGGSQSSIFAELENLAYSLPLEVTPQLITGSDCNGLAYSSQATQLIGYGADNLTSLTASLVVYTQTSNLIPQNQLDEWLAP